MFFSTQTKKEVSDSQLITNYKNFHDLSSLGILFQRYSYLVFCICQKYLKNEEDRKDAVMDIFDKLAEDLKQYNISNFKSWLYTVTKNHCLMKLRRTRELPKILSSWPILGANLLIFR